MRSGLRRMGVRRLHYCCRGYPSMRVRSYVPVLVFSCSCLLLLLTAPLLHYQNPSSSSSSSSAFRRWNSSLGFRQWFCNDDCFQAEYPLLLNQPQACNLYQGQKKVDIIFFILTPPNGERTRQVIRDTWASVTRNNSSPFFRHVFVTGVTQDPGRMRRLREEADRFRDVVVSGFVDSYNNLTLKTITSLRWITRYCPQARFFFKVDDDVWVNTARLLQRFQEAEDELQQGLGGYCLMPPSVIRDTSSKWYASYEDYPYDNYPEYCSGVSYGAGLSVAQQILSVYRKVPFFYLEDVYVGLCLRELNLSTVHFPEMSAHRGWDLCQAVSKDVITYHRIWPSLMTLIWNLKTCDSAGSWWRFLTGEFVVF